MVEKFLNSVIDNVVHNKNNVSEIKSYFLSEIENNKQNADIFASKLENIKSQLKEDLNFFMDSDPAVDSEEEVIIAYPGFKAITYYRIAHTLRELGYSLKSRIISESAHTSTGIDIHPGATISSPFFIDHGTGIVIGETAVVGKYVKIYQGVTLGALSLSKGSKLKGTKRHPTIGDEVVIYAGASILGDIKVGNNVTIGSNVFLTEDIPNDTKVHIGKPELVFTKKSK